MADIVAALREPSRDSSSSSSRDSTTRHNAIDTPRSSSARQTLAMLAASGGGGGGAATTTVTAPSLEERVRANLDELARPATLDASGGGAAMTSSASSSSLVDAPPRCEPRLPFNPFLVDASVPPANATTSAVVDAMNPFLN